MAIKPYKNHTANTQKLYYNKDENITDNTRAFSNKLLMDQIREIIPNHTIQCPAEWGNEDELLIINLKEYLN